MTKPQRKGYEMTKKQKDLWDTFRFHQRESVDLYGAILGNALNNVWWKGYATALAEFGVISKTACEDVLEWCPK